MSGYTLIAIKVIVSALYLAAVSNMFYQYATNGTPIPVHSLVVIVLLMFVNDAHDIYRLVVKYLHPNKN